MLPVGPLHEGIGTVTCLEGDGRVTINRLATDGILDLSAPGRYRASFDHIGPPRYRAVESREVEVVAGHVVDVVIDLEKP